MPRSSQTETKTPPVAARNGGENGQKSVAAANGTLAKPTQTVQQRTPPPDNFAHIQPCAHLKSVLETKAHDTVLSTYQQAVAISIAVNPLLLKHVVYTLKKDGSKVPHTKLTEYKSQALRCTTCKRCSYDLVFICLQCPHVGCYNEHAKAHATSQNHVFAIDSHNGLLYCFSCGDYINNAALNRIRLATIATFVGGDAPLDTDASESLLLLAGYSKPSSHAAVGLKGIVNLGLTCFMNCILQTLLHNPLARYHFFNNDFHYFHCALQGAYMDEFIDEHSACVTCLLDGIFKEFFTSSSTEGFGITTLLTTAWYKNRLLAGFQEQDAHEFWQFLLNELHSDYERVAEAANVPLLPCKCILHSTFHGLLESSVTCGNCGAVTSTVDPLVDLSLEINHLNASPSLYDCLDQFTHKEALDMMYKCRLCRTETKAHRSLRIKKIPPVLSIQLKRFKHNVSNDSASKIESKVDAPLFLNLTRYASDYDASAPDNIDNNKVYELFAVVTHMGLVNTGHYIALVKNSTGQWFKFDDSVVSHISHEEVKNTNAYLLFYIAHNI